MSWECSSRRCSYPPRNIYTSALYKVLLALKILTGTGQCLENPGGVKLEDIAMFYLKYYCVDGDVKSQVCASLRYGVKKNFIKKKKDKFSLITPAAAIHLAPCKCKSEQLKRIECIFPSNYTNERDNSSPCDPCCEPVNICRRPKSTCKISNKKCSKPCRPPKKRKKRPKMMPWCEANEQQYSPCPPKKRKANPCQQEEDPCMDESSCFRPNDTLGFDIQRERCRNTPPSVSESEDDDEDQQQMCCKPCKPQKSPPCCCNNNSKEDTESSSSIECFPKNRNCFK